MTSYLLKKQPEMQSTETSFCIFLRSNNQVLLKFYYLIRFFFALIRLNSRYCQLMELFKSKESFKEKVDSENK